MATGEQALTVREHSMEIVRPAVSVQEALAAWAEYQEMKKALATDDDRQEIQGREFLKKSYWRKVGRFYKLNTELLKEWHEDIPQGRVFYAVYRAFHPSGAYADGDGADFCSSPDEYHNTRGTAHTRAKNRAISDLVGGGEVSAEEVSGGRKGESYPPDNTQHWCEEHQAEWFKRGKMRNYAHPIGDTKEWCNEPSVKAPVIEAGPQTPAEAPVGQGPAVAPQQQASQPTPQGDLSPEEFWQWVETRMRRADILKYLDMPMNVWVLKNQPTPFLAARNTIEAKLKTGVKP